MWAVYGFGHHTLSHPWRLSAESEKLDLMKDGISWSSVLELQAAGSLPHVSACLSPGCICPERALSKHAKGFLGIRVVILSSLSVIITFFLGVQVGELSKREKEIKIEGMEG